MRALSNFFVYLGLYLSFCVVSGVAQPKPLTNALREAWGYLKLEGYGAPQTFDSFFKNKCRLFQEPSAMSGEVLDCVITQFFSQFFEDKWITPNELFPEHGPVLYSRVLSKLPSANTVNARAHPRMPLAYVGVGFLRTWFTFMHLEDHFSDLVLVDCDAAICFCNAVQKLILLMSTSVEDYKALLAAKHVDEWLQRFKARGELLSTEDLRFLRGVFIGHTAIHDTIAQVMHWNLGKASADMRYNLVKYTLDAWVEGDIGDAYYKRLKRMVEEGRVHIIQEHIEAESPRLCNQLIALCEARGVRLGMIDLSNMFTLPQLENWIADKTFDDEQLKYINPLDFFKFIQHLALLKSTDGHFLGVPIVTPSTIFVGTTWQHTPNDTDLFHPSKALLHWAISLSDLRLCRLTFVAMKADDVWVQCSEEELNARLAQWHRLHQPEPVEGLETVFTEEETPSASNIRTVRTVRTESARGGVPSAFLHPWGGVFCNPATK